MARMRDAGFCLTCFCTILRSRVGYAHRWGRFAGMRFLLGRANGGRPGGDEWKFTLLEHDAGGSFQKTVTSKSNFGFNFETAAEFKLFVKFGVKFGATGNFEKSNSEVVTISSESDQLGDARILFDNPVIIPGTSSRYFVSTGAVNFAIEPVMKINDSRPYPYID